MGQSYADAAEYAAATGDTSTTPERAEAELATLSARLRAELGVPESRELSGDSLLVARAAVCDAARKKLVSVSIDGLGDIGGVTQASFTANGFQGSYTMQNPSGSAYFDRSMLAELRRLLGRGARIGCARRSYGALS